MVLGCARYACPVGKKHTPVKQNDSGHASRARSRALGAKSRRDARAPPCPLRPVLCPCPLPPTMLPLSPAPCPLSLSPVTVLCPLSPAIALRAASAVSAVGAGCAPYQTFSRYAARALSAGWVRYAVCARTCLRAFVCARMRACIAVATKLFLRRLRLRRIRHPGFRNDGCVWELRPRAQAAPIRNTEVPKSGCSRTCSLRELLPIRSCVRVCLRVCEREGEIAWARSWYSQDKELQQQREAKNKTTTGVLREGRLTIARTMAKHASLRCSKPGMQNNMKLKK